MSIFFRRTVSVLYSQVRSKVVFRVYVKLLDANVVFPSTLSPVLPGIKPHLFFTPSHCRQLGGESMVGSGDRARKSVPVAWKPPSTA